jgi:hypothetical protein
VPRKLRPITLLTLVAQFSVAALAQHPTGLLADEPQVIAARPQLRAATALDDISPRELNLANQLPPAGDQGKQSSCVSFVVAYSTASYFRAASTSADDLVQEDYDAATTLMSPAFLHNYLLDRHKDKTYAPCKDRGTRFEWALDAIQNVGTVPWSVFPYKPNDDRACDLSVDHLLRRAESYRVRDARRPQMFTTVWNSAIGAEDLRTVLIPLSQGIPVMAGIQTNKAFHNYRGGVLSDTSGLGNVRAHGRHAVVVAGYDMDERKLLILNSWGTQNWAQEQERGLEGCAWVTFEFFEEAAFVAYTFIQKPRFTRPGQIEWEDIPGVEIIPGADPEKVDRNWERVKPGMHWRDVLDLLGGPGGSLTLDANTRAAKDGQWFYGTRRSDGTRLDVWISWAEGKVATIGPELDYKAHGADPEKVDRNWERVKPGMHWRDVLDLLGGPGGSLTLDANTRAAKGGQWFYGTRRSDGTRLDVWISWAEGKVATIGPELDYKAHGADPEKVDRNWERVKPGMHWRDVLDLLGGPGGSLTLDANTRAAKGGQWFYGTRRSDGTRLDVWISWAEGKVATIGPELDYKAHGADPEKVDRNWERVKPGMHWRDVLDLLGGPGGSLTLDANTRAAKGGQWFYGTRRSDGTRLDVWISWAEGKVKSISAEVNATRR